MTDTLSIIHRRWLGQRPRQHYHPEVRQFIEADRVAMARVEADVRKERAEKKRAEEDRRKRAQVSRIEQRMASLEDMKRKILASLDESEGPEPPRGA